MSAGLDLEAGRETRSPGRPRDERASVAILTAALRQVEEFGYARMSMESVAAEAGVSRATIYRRFVSKADVVTAAIAALSDAGATTTAHEGAPRAGLIAYLEGFDARFSLYCLEVLGSLLAEREDPRALALHRERVVAPRVALVRHLLERARDLGEMGEGADLTLAAEMLVGSVFARSVTGAGASPGWAARAVDAVLLGMSPAPGAA